MSNKKFVLDGDNLAKFEALASVLTQEQIGEYFGVSKRTITNEMRRNQKAASAFYRGKAQAVASVASTLLSKAKEGDNACMMFYLKTQAGWRETQNIDHTTNGESLNRPVTKLTDEELANIASGSR